MNHARHDVPAQLVGAEPMTPRRRLEGFEKIDVTGAIRDWRKERLGAFKFLELGVDKLRGPLAELHSHQVAPKDWKIRLAFILGVVRFVVGDEIGEQRHEDKNTDNEKAGERDRIAFEALPHIGPQPASFGGLRYHVLGCRIRRCHDR